MPANKRGRGYKSPKTSATLKAKGYKNALKFSTDQVDKRYKAYLAYCEWIAMGNSAKSFVYEDEDGVCLLGVTIEKYAKESKFDPIHMEKALALCQREWEGVVQSSARGLNSKANVASLQMLMRNRFGWDKREKEEPQPVQIELRYPEPKS